VDVDDVARSPFVEEVLAIGLDPLERAAVDAGGTVEAALGRGHADGAAAEQLGVVQRQPVERMALGHLPNVGGRTAHPRGRA